MRDKKGSLLENMRHSATHVLAASVLKLYPETKVAIGPVIENGFYYDFEFKKPISKNDLEKIESKMVQTTLLNLPLRQEDVSTSQAKKLFKNQPYKLELIDDLKKKGSKKVSLYHLGDIFTDLCSGPHIKLTGQIGPFKLLSIAGAYLRGDEKNKMLTRIYGTCFPSKKELNKYLWQVEEAKKRDHRILGRKLDLFVIDENIGKGLPLLTAKGTIIKRQILDYEYQLEKEAGFQHVSTPHIAKVKIYKKTGHWQHYREMMYAPFGIEGEEYVVKPMNCPHHYMIYASQPRSYRELPLRLAETGTCYRFEKTGELSGLIRVRALSIDDAHILMTESQINDEFKLCINLVKRMFQAFQLKDYYVRLSLSDPLDAIKYITDKKTWQEAGNKLRKIVKDNQLKYKEVRGEASFYGPKLDYMVKDSLGREWQMSTLQLDLFMAKKLNLTYIDKNGNKKHPVILHRGLTGSLERTLGILIEHYGGAFPLWLSPVQVIVIPIAERHKEYAKNVVVKLAQQSAQQAGPLRVKLDNRNETMQAKIREATLQKVPYLVIIGNREIQLTANSLQQTAMYISVRSREGKDLGQMSLAQFLEKLKKEIEKKI